MKCLKLILGSAAVAGLLALGSAHAADMNTISEDVQTKVYQLLDKDVTVVKFGTDSAAVSDSDANSLRALVNSVKGDTSIDRFVVAAWSGQEYPATKEIKLDKHDRDLADQRKDHVTKILKDAGVKNVDSFSMAEHPGWLARVFNTEQAKLKGAGKIKDAEDQIVADLGKRIRDKGGPDTAVVIIKHKNELSAH